MRLADDDALRKAVESRTRFDQPKLEIAWENDWEHDFSDWSECVEDISVEYSLDSSLPDEAQIVQGTSMGTMTVKLSGRRRRDKLHAFQIFNPYRGDSPIYGYKLLDVAIRLSSVVQVEDGERTVREFTGYIRSIDIDQSDGTIEIDCWDTLQLTQRNITLPRIALLARDDGYNYNACAATTSWLVDRVLRENGIYTGPKPVEGCRALWTFCGGYVHEIGRFGGPSAKIVDFSLAGDSAGKAWSDIEDKFEQGKYGLAAKPGNKNYVLNINSELSEAFIGPHDRKSYTVGISMWVKLEDELKAGDAPQWILIWGESAEAETGKIQFGMTIDKPGQCNVFVYYGGDVSEHFTESIPTDGEWHFLTCAISFNPGSNSVLALYLDDEWIKSQSVGTELTVDHSKENHDVTTGTVICHLNATQQHLQVWEQEVSDFKKAELPKHPPEGQEVPRPDIGSSVQMMVNLPEISQTSGWDVIKDSVNSEYGVLYSTEDGKVIFRNRAELNTMYGYGTADEDPVVPETVRTLYPDDFDNVPISSNIESVRNDISYKVRSKLCRVDVAYKSDDPDSYNTPAHTENGFSGGDGDGIPLEDDVILVYRLGDGTAPPDKPNHTVWDLDPDATTLPDDYGTWAPIKVSNGDKVKSGTSVAVGQKQDWRRMVVSVKNDTANDIKLAFPARNNGAESGGLSIMGVVMFEAKDRARDESIKSESSIKKYRHRELDMEESDYLQSPASGRWIADYLLGALKEPTPVTDAITIPHDPRLQIGDAINLDDRNGSGSLISAAISGKTIDWSDSGFVDKLTIKFLVKQDRWILGDAQRSILGKSTELHAER